MSEDSQKSTETQRLDDFVSLFLAHQRRIYQYILGLVCDPNDADDLLQETSTTLWEKFDQFEPGSSFFAWAAKIAYYKVSNFRTSKRRGDELLDPDTVDLMASEAAWQDDVQGQHHEALQHCMGKLSSPDRQLIGDRYQPDYDRQATAASLGRPANSISKSLARIRDVLLHCIRRQLDQLDQSDHHDSGEGR